MVFATIGSAGVSGAAPRGVTTKTLAAAGIPAAACGVLSGATVSYLTTNGAVTRVTVSGLPAACNGALVSLSLVNGAGTNLGSGGPVSVSGGSATVGSLTANPTSASVTSVQLLAIGP